MKENSFSRERDLWASVLRQAIDDLSHKNDLIREQAIAWFNQNKNSLPLVKYDEKSNWDGKGCDPDIGSFRWVCSIFGLHAKGVRKILLDRHKEKPDRLFNKILKLKPKECHQVFINENHSQ